MANLPPELISASNYLVAEDLAVATPSERMNYFHALEPSSMDRCVGPALKGFGIRGLGFQGFGIRFYVLRGLGVQGLGLGFMGLGVWG